VALFCPVANVLENQCEKINLICVVSVLEKRDKSLLSVFNALEKRGVFTTSCRYCF
jgi:hypothetical protein